MTTVTVSPKFQIVIPLDVRRRWQLQPGARLQIIEFNGGVRLVPEVAPASLRGIARGMDTSLKRDPDRAL
jgi:AbrB family looped-hinge helix DNA binding protein